MPPAGPRIAALLGAVLALAACGTTASPSTSGPPSGTTEPASQPPDLLAVVCQPAPKAFDPSDFDLTGPWAGDDGGIYYLRQLGAVVWWTGMSDRDSGPLGLGRSWSNVGRGVINGLHVDSEWSDVPRGGAAGNGTLVLIIQDDGTGNIQMVTSGATGGFGNRIWTPCSPVEQQVAEYLLTYGGEATQYAQILTLDECDRLAALDTSVTAPLNTAEAGSPEFQAALGYSHAISERQLALGC